MSEKEEDDHKSAKSSRQQRLITAELGQLEEAASSRPKSSKINSATTNDLATADDADEDDEDIDDDDDEDNDDMDEEDYNDEEDYDDEYMDEFIENPFYEYQLPQQPSRQQSSGEKKSSRVDVKPAAKKRESNVDDDVDDERRYVEETVKPLSAIAPKIYQQDESAEIGISSTPAFQCLEELFQNGKLTGTQVAELKAKYIELHTMLKKSRENEARLLNDSKDYMKKIEQQKEIMQKVDAFPDNLNNDVLKLRAQFLKYENDAACSDERFYELQYKLAGLEEDKAILEREYARMPKPQELERRIEQLKFQNTELSREIVQAQGEISELKKNIDEKGFEIERKKKDLDAVIDLVENYKNEYVNTNMQPYQIAKEIDKISTEKEEVNKEIQRIENELKIASAQLSESERRLMEQEDKNNELVSSINKEKNACFEKERELNNKTKEYEHEKEKEVVFLSDKATLELALKHAQAEKKLEKEAFARAKAESENEHRNVKKLELQLKACQDSLTNVKLAYEHIMEKKNQQPEINETNLIDKRNKLLKEVEQLNKELNKQYALTNIQKVEVETRIEIEERLLCEQSNFRIEAVEATRLAAIKADEKEQKAREFVKAETRYKKAIEDLKVKDNLIDEHQKRLRELKIKLKDFAKMYDLIKSDRNKCVNQIQVCTQRAAEMKEKLKILNNEFEIMRTSVGQKEKQLQRQKLKYTNAISVRDSIRAEREKQRAQLEKLDLAFEQQKMQLAGYNARVSASEHEAVRARVYYEECLKERNARGVEVIKRSEEVCVIGERVNVQASVLTRANLELTAREEELRLLHVCKREEERVVALIRKQVPREEALSAELDALRKQLIESQDTLVKLEEQVEDCHDPERIRLLDGPEETVEALMRKLEKIEYKLVKVEEQCLEKDLVLQQLKRISGKVENKVETNKDDTLALAKKINKMQSQIKQTTKKMMACVSELSIAQADALRMQEEVKNKEILLEECHNRMQMGEPPNEEIELEWQRLSSMEERAKTRGENTTTDEKTGIYTMPDGYATTAEPRPNAYVPQSGTDLPLPKPYGRLAPFKPQEPGSNMRHIKKPIPTPIEI